MKRLLRSKAVQGLLAALTAAWLRLLIRTLRWRYEGEAAARALIEAPEGAIVLFWHGRIAAGVACRPVLGQKPRRAMISLSRDGEFIAMAARAVGFPAIRGSMSKGGASVLRQAVEALRAGEIVLITPDGPRGPNQTLPLGPVQLARISGAPVLLVGLATRPALRFRSWDEAAVPLPFARAAGVAVGPFRVGRRTDEAGLEAVRADWQARMREAQGRAEAMLAGAA
ncbi:MAG TPA: lysophospholipid acyltransferase family protein [Caulobacteraceae bacterium]|nr:lysophospholipid acyltransferase family protein [Caulobacteraceae bacterium]